MNGPIVVGTDGSDTATRAVDAAIALAKAFSQDLHLVSAYRPDPSPSGDVPAEIRSTLLPTGQVDAILADATSRCKVAGVTTEPHAVLGDAAEAILDVAVQVEADLIVVGNRGIASKARFLLGNVPSKVVHHSPCSTYIVHTTA